MEQQKTGSESDKEALLKFMQDAECLDALSKWTNDFNIFDVLKISRTEIRHSNLLSWLIDPNENHGLGDSFLIWNNCLVIKRIGSKLSQQQKRNRVIEKKVAIILNFWTDVSIYRSQTFKIQDYDNNN